MAPMSTAEKLMVKNDLSRVLRKQLYSSQRTVLEKLGIYCHGSEAVNLDFDALEDSLLWQLRRELRNLLVGSNGDGKVGTDPAGKDGEDDEAAKKALRVAMLKSRFAETIAKANGGTPEDPRERAEIKKKAEIRKNEREEGESKRRRQEQINKERQGARMALELVVEKSVISKANGGKRDERERAEIRKKKREEDELKRRRQEQINKERQAARLALELVEKSVDVVDNFKVMKEFEMLINGCAC